MAILAEEVYIKQPSERRLYSVDFSSLLREDESISTIKEVSVARRGGGGEDELLVQEEEIDGQEITFWISLGLPYQVYRIQTQITTSTGQHLEGDVLLEVAG